MSLHSHSLPLLLLSLAASAASAGAPQPTQAEPSSVSDYASMPLQPGEGSAVALKLAGQLTNYFPIRDQARSYAAMLRSNAARDRYQTGTRASLAERITKDLMAVHKDGHLKVFATDPAQLNAPPSPPKGLPPAIQSAKWISPGIAYIRPTAFLQQDDEIEAFRAFMQDHRTARTLIFDLRNDHGGGNAEPDIVFSYLFASKTPLTKLEMTRATYDETGWPFPATQTLEVTKSKNTVTGTRYALPGEATPLRSAKVFVLVSNATNSAAEGFAIALKSTGRGTLIGEATGGADHFGAPRLINDHFGVFMPLGRTYDVKTGKDWEGTGVEPDIAVDPRQALVVALERAGLSAEEAVRLDAMEVPAEPVHRETLQSR